MSPTVYLAGPIKGRTYGDATEWRNAAIEDLARHGIVGLSPLRAKNYLQGIGVLGDSYQESVLSCDRGITTRDRLDATTCDVLFVNFLGATSVSIGTCMEIAWADANRIPIVVCIETLGNVHDHGMIRDCTGFRVQTLSEGLDIVVAILGARVIGFAPGIQIDALSLGAEVRRLGLAGD